jgi:phthalate 4,5-dioxygenase oxygenase subunit
MSNDDNDAFLLEVTAGTPMGSLIREFWVPVVRSEMLVAAGAPVRLRVFAQNFVGFRTPDGRVGLFDERCPHRGVSLALARNEDNGLRCIFHGWKIDVSGKVTEVPTEPSETRVAFAAQVKFSCYPAHEEAGIVWGWFGKSKPPPFPTFEFSMLPPAHVVSFVGHLNCHWLQALEMLLDPAHVGILHRSHLRDGQLQKLKDGRNIRLPILMGDPPPRIEIESTDYGYRGAAIRKLEDGSLYVRVTEWVMPFFSFLATTPGETRSLYIAIPVDDENTQFWYVGWNTARPLDVGALKANALGANDPNNFSVGVGSLNTLWGQNRAIMADGHFTGFATSMHEEVIVPQAQGVRQNIGAQNLGTSDKMIVASRETLARLARQLSSGVAPALPRSNDLRVLKPISGFCNDGQRWQDLSA